MTERYVNLYLVECVPGGPEEGGWWYDAGSPLESEGPYESDSFALDVAYNRMYGKMTELMDEKKARGERGRTSTIGTADYLVFIEGHPARAYPEETPRYQ